jgi:GDP-mannose 6-dehydrogenase
MKHGIDVSTAHSFFTQDTRLNISPYYLKPGLPFGGSCLPKDLRELQYLIKKTGYNYPLVESIIPSNDSYLRIISDKVMGRGHKKITFLGLSFKQNTDDLRESPALRILNELNGLGGFEIKIVDPDLTVENLRIDFPYLFTMIANPETAVSDTDLLVVTKKYPEIKAVFAEKGIDILDFTNYNKGLQD